MAEEKPMRLSQVARKLNVGISTITEHLAAKGYEVERKPSARISPEQFNLLAKEFESSVLDKEEASGLTIGGKRSENMVIDSGGTPQKESREEEEEVFIKGGYKSYSSTEEDETKSQEKSSGEEVKDKEEEKEDKEEKNKKDEHETSEAEKPESDEKEAADQESESPRLQGIKVVGKIDLEEKKKQTPSKTKKSKTDKTETTTKQENSKAKSAEVEDKDKDKEEKGEKEQQETAEKSDQKKDKKEEEKAAEKDKEDTEVKAEKETPETPETTEQDQEKETTTETETTIAQSSPEQEDTTTTEEITETGETENQEEAKPEEASSSEETIGAKADQLKGLTVLGKIDLPEKSKKNVKPVASSDEQQKKKKKRPRKRINTQQEAKQQGQGQRQGQGQGAKKEGPKQGEEARKEKAKQQQQPKGKQRRQKAVPKREEISDKEIQEQIKDTLSKLSSGGKSKIAKGSKNRYDKRKQLAREEEEKMLKEQEEAKKLNVTEFISANDLASLMDVSVNEVISTCMSLGMFVSINQRLDAETITVIADEFGYDVDFSTSEEELEVKEEEEKVENLQERAPIVTIMGHVDHGKTSLLDYIRSAKVTAGEAGGITQHIGAYDVTTESGKRVAFLDTPGHEAFTAMRARGAKVTDVVIIVVAADDGIKPQTKEAINHAQVAGVPIVIAINKIDKPNADPNKVREELANINILVEDWGGKYQVQEISAKTGQGIENLLEKVLLESEILELQADPKKHAAGTVIESTLDRGRGYLTTLLVQSGTLNVGDVILAGPYHGRVRAMFDHRGNKVQKIGPSTPVLILGLSGAPQAGDRFNVMESEREARDIANRRQQIQREQSLRTKKHITLDEIGRRLAIGSFKELNIIVKGDVDGSVEALSDSLLKLSTEEIQVNIIHKGVGQISESDVLLASASDAIIVGFQVRPSSSARTLADKEEIEIRLYSVIYDAINDVKDAMEGMLAPKLEEIITGNVEVREVFKISKVGRVAGCYVTEGFIKRNNKVRLIRDGIVAFTGEIDTLKRFKEDVNEVKAGYECGISLKNYNDIEVGDVIEGFEEKEVKRSLGQTQQEKQEQQG